MGWSLVLQLLRPNRVIVGWLHFPSYLFDRRSVPQGLRAVPLSSFALHKGKALF